MLDIQRKKLKISVKELDLFIKADATSTKYYIEKHYLENKIFRYLLFLKIKGLSLDDFFEEIIDQNQDEINELLNEIEEITKKIDKIKKSNKKMEDVYK